MNRAAIRTIVVFSTFAALAGCGGEGLAGSTAEIGTIQVQIGGQVVVYSVEYDEEEGRSGFQLRDVMGNPSVDISASSVKRSDMDNPPGYISIAKQLAIYGMQSVSVGDAQHWGNPLESMGEGGSAKVNFEEQGENGTWAGTFAATLVRQDPAAPVDATQAGTLTAPVDISGSFSVTPRN